MAPIALESQTIADSTPSAAVELKQLKAESTTGAKLVDYEKFLSIESASRYPSPLKDIAVK